MKIKILNVDEHVLIKNNLTKSGKSLVKRKLQLRDDKIPDTLIYIFELKINELNGSFVERRELIDNILLLSF